MEGRIAVTENDLLRALQEAMQQQEDTPGAFTVAELCEATGRGEKAVRKMLRALIADGRAEVVSKQATNLAGVTVRIPAYRAA